MIDVPDKLQVSQIGIACPFCGAKATKDCFTTLKGFAAIHVARIKAAASMSVAAKRKRNGAMKPSKEFSRRRITPVNRQPNATQH
jgi:hypothetical protein